MRQFKYKLGREQCEWCGQFFPSARAVKIHQTRGCIAVKHRVQQRELSDF